MCCFETVCSFLYCLSCVRGLASGSNSANSCGLSSLILYLDAYIVHIDMVHLDLRPANIFLTSAPSYREMCPSDPQRLVQMSQVPAVAPVSTSFSLFSNIINAAPLYKHGSSGCGSSGSSGKATATNNQSGNSHNTTAGASDTEGDSTTTAALLDDTYDVRAEVERLLVNRKYVIKVGDLGHCCRVDEKNAIQVLCARLVCVFVHHICLYSAIFILRICNVWHWR